MGTRCPPFVLGNFFECFVISLVAQTKFGLSDMYGQLCMDIQLQWIFVMEIIK
jgi:hypothetical protein